MIIDEDQEAEKISKLHDGPSYLQIKNKSESIYIYRESKHKHKLTHTHLFNLKNEHRSAKKIVRSLQQGVVPGNACYIIFPLLQQR